MKIKNTLIIAATICVSSSSLVAGVADINYGSAAAAGGAQFFGSDAGAADSISIGYFAGNTVNTDLTGWNAYDTSSTFTVPGTGYNNGGGTLTDVDTTAGDGLIGYILIQDGALSALVTLNSWDTISGTVTPAPKPTLAFQFGSGATAAGITSFEAAGTTLTITDGEGTNFAGGFSGTGVSFRLSAVAVPEPSTFAALAGFLALGCVALRRRK